MAVASVFTPPTKYLKSNEKYIYADDENIRIRHYIQLKIGRNVRFDKYTIYSHPIERKVISIFPTIKDAYANQIFIFTFLPYASVPVLATLLLMASARIKTDKTMRGELC